MASAAEDNAGARRKITELRVVDLRIELEKRGLDKSGVKAVLVDKLQKALLEEGADANEIVIDGSSAKGGARKSTPRRVTEKPDEEHDEPFEEMDTDELMDGEFLQVDSTGDQSLDGLSQDEELTLDGITVDDQVTDEEVLRKVKPDVLLDTIDEDDDINDDINDDAINISAEDDQLLTEDEAIGDPSEEAGASSIVGGPGTTDEDQFETTPATDSSTPAPDVEGENDNKKVVTDSVATEKQEVDNESLIVHVDEPSLLELDADLTKPEEKISPTEESATVPPADDAQKEPSSGKEKWEFETQEKKERPDESEKDAQPVGSSSVEKNTDKSAGKESTGEKKETPSASTTDNQRRSSTGSSSGKPTSEKERRPGSGKSGGRNLWVCNLSKTTRAADLKAAFSKYGKVAGAKVVTNARSPGTLCYGFVMMSASSEAQRAMNHLHRTELHGRTIHVEWAGNDPVPGGRKPPLIPPSLLASEKEKEEAKEAAKTSSSETTKTEKAAEKVKVKTEGGNVEGKDVKKPDSSPSVKLPVKTEEKKPVVKKEPSSKEGSQQRASSKENLDKEKEKEKEKKDILSLDKIKEQRDKERHRNREREMREIERRRERERAEQFRRQRELLRRRTREEEEKIRREREQLKLQRMQLEQERLERERLERERIRLQQERQREQERLERERALSMQLRLEQEHRSALKRTLDARGMPLHEMDPYMGEQKRRLAMESGLIPPPVVMPPPMEMQGGMMNNQRGPDIGGDRRFDRRDHRGVDRREEPAGRFSNVGRFRDDARAHREERGGPRRDDARKAPVRRDDNRREEARRSDTRREEGRREEQRKEVQRREPPRREEPSRREEAPHRADPPRRSDNRRDDNYQRRDVRESRGNTSSHPRQEIHRREEPTKRDEPVRREQPQGGRFGGEKDERRVIATNRTISNRTERFESRSSRGDGNQFTTEQGDSGLQSRRRTERDRAQPETTRGRDAEKARGSFNAERGRYDAGGDGHFQRRTSPSRSRPQQSRDSWKQDHHSNISSSDTRRVTASHDSWKQNQQSSQQSSDRRVELRTVDHHHERPAAREIIDHSSSFNRSRLSDFPEEIAQESSTWNAGSNSRSLGSFSERSMMRDGMQRHSSNSDIGSGLVASNSRSDDKWSSGRIDQTLNTQQDRWPGGVSLSGISSSLASGMTQSSQPLNTMLGNAGPSGFGTSFSTNALGNLINSISGSSASSGSNFGLDRRNMQSDNRFDSFPSVQGMRRF